MRQKIDVGDGLVAAGAGLLLVSLFLDWYSPGANAWSAFELIDLALAGLAVAALVGVVRPPGGEPARWASLAGAAALMLVASQLVDPPPGAEEDVRQVGAWLALAASLAMAAGGALAAASISVTVDFGGRERRRRVPAVDRREGPDPREPAGGPRPPRQTPAEAASEPRDTGPAPEALAPEDEDERTQAYDTLADEGDPPRAGRPGGADTPTTG